jgi:hypothetical protein
MLVLDNLYNHEGHEEHENENNFMSFMAETIFCVQKLLKSYFLNPYKHPGAYRKPHHEY